MLKSLLLIFIVGTVAFAQEKPIEKDIFLDESSGLLYEMTAGSFYYDEIPQQEHKQQQKQPNAEGNAKEPNATKTGIGNCFTGECPPGYYCGPFGIMFNGPFCHPLPRLEQFGANHPDCADLGQTHNGAQFLVRYTVIGRPYMQVRKYNRHASCGGGWVEAPESPLLLPANGRLEVTVYNTATPDCHHPVLGQWESYVTVDYQQSNHDWFTFYNSACSNPAVQSCWSASGYCP